MRGLLGEVRDAEEVAWRVVTQRDLLCSAVVLVYFGGEGGEGAAEGQGGLQGGIRGDRPIGDAQHAHAGRCSSSSGRFDRARRARRRRRRRRGSGGRAALGVAAGQVQQLREACPVRAAGPAAHLVVDPDQQRHQVELAGQAAALLLQGGQGRGGQRGKWHSGHTLFGMHTHTLHASYLSLNSTHELVSRPAGGGDDLQVHCHGSWGQLEGRRHLVWPRQLLRHGFSYGVRVS